jgi:hypothetical protein
MNKTGNIRSEINNRQRNPWKQAKLPTHSPVISHLNYDSNLFILTGAFFGVIFFTGCLPRCCGSRAGPAATAAGFPLLVPGKMQRNRH